MHESMHYRTEIATTPASANICDAAKSMARFAVGSVVVVDDRQRPIGILTDRDLTTRVVAGGLDPEATTASEVMSKPLVSATADLALDEVVRRMAAAQVRRMPIVENEKLVGFVSIDDVLVKLGHEIDDLGEAVVREVMDSRGEGRKERRREELDESLANLKTQAAKAAGDARVAVQREIDSLRERMRKLLE